MQGSSKTWSAVLVSSCEAQASCMRAAAPASSRNNDQGHGGDLFMGASFSRAAG